MSVDDIPLPPQEFMDSVAGLPTTSEMHIAVGKHIYDLVMARCQIQPTNAVLDIGSGCGRVASHFAGNISGDYHGLDIVLPMVEWCRANISTLYPNFYFHHADVNNTLYRVEGTDASTYAFPFPSNTFDTIFATSVFTHLVPASARQYARETYRTLRPNGRALLTFMLVHDAWRQKRAAGERFPVDFPDQGDGYRTADRNNPESVVAFEETDATRLLIEAGLTVEEVSRGTWSGNRGWTWQDAILVSKP